MEADEINIEALLHELADIILDKDNQLDAMRFDHGGRKAGQRVRLKLLEVINYARFIRKKISEKNRKMLPKKMHWKYGRGNNVRWAYRDIPIKHPCQATIQFGLKEGKTCGRESKYRRPNGKEFADLPEFVCGMHNRLFETRCRELGISAKCKRIENEE